jgi:hypothetical protein
VDREFDLDRELLSGGSIRTQDRNSIYQGEVKYLFNAGPIRAALGGSRAVSDNRSYDTVENFQSDGETASSGEGFI